MRTVMRLKKFQMQRKAMTAPTRNQRADHDALDELLFAALPDHKAESGLSRIGGAYDCWRRESPVRSARGCLAGGRVHPFPRPSAVPPDWPTPEEVSSKRALFAPA